MLKVDMKRSLLNKDLQKSCEFIVQKAEAGSDHPPKPVTFNINPDSIQNVKEVRFFLCSIIMHIEIILCFGPNRAVNC